MCGPSYNPTYKDTRAEILANGLAQLQSQASGPIWLGSLVGSSYQVESLATKLQWLWSPFYGPIWTRRQICNPAQLLSIAFSPTWPGSLPRESRHPVDAPGQGTKPVVLSECSQPAATPWLQSMSSGLTQIETCDSKPHLTEDATTWPLQNPKMS